VDQLCWDPKHADLIATASGDKTVRLWDARSKWLFRYTIYFSMSYQKGGDLFYNLGDLLYGYIFLIQYKPIPYMQFGMLIYLKIFL